jgi:hypothetical protein
MQSTLRKMQDDLVNAGWRIKQISHAPDGKPVIVGFENWAGYVAVISILGFPIGCGMAIYLKEHRQNPFPGIYVATASWALCLAALAIKNRIKKSNWIYIDARCIDKEIRKVAARKGRTWASRILCEFEHKGAIVQCTPTVHWSTFHSESAAHQFLNSRIDPSGGCTLRVNPENPKEANLADRRI